LKGLLMSQRQYYTVELNVDMDDQEIGMLQDHRFLCNIGPTSFHTNKNTIDLTMSEPNKKIAFAMIANWLDKANLCDNIMTIKDITEYSTNYVSSDLDALIKAGKERRDESKRSRNQKRRRKA
jgi:hypothetical protein